MSGNKGGPPPGEKIYARRYILLARDGSYLDSFSDHEAAEREWLRRTKGRGTLIDSRRHRVAKTPQPDLWRRFLDWLFRRKKKPGDGTETLRGPHGGLSQDQLMEMRSALHAPKKKGLRELISKFSKPGRLLGKDRTEADPEKVYRLVKEVDRLDLPVFAAAKKRDDKAKQMIPVTRLRTRVKMKPSADPSEQDDRETRERRDPDRIPANDIDVRPIRETRELKRMVKKTSLALPYEMLADKIARRELGVIEYRESRRREGESTRARKDQTPREGDDVETGVETVERGREPDGQLLYILLDGSGSMMCDRKYHLAVAVAAAVIGRNFDSESRYRYRLFDSRVWESYDGSTPEGKRALISDIRRNANSGGGTIILNAIEQAVIDIRTIAKPGDRPEILLITDGQDYVMPEELHRLLGDDITLHTVAILNGNKDLARYSGTYTVLTFKDGEVAIQDTDPYPYNDFRML